MTSNRKPRDLRARFLSAAATLAAGGFLAATLIAAPVQLRVAGGGDVISATTAFAAAKNRDGKKDRDKRGRNRKGRNGKNGEPGQPGSNGENSPDGEPGEPGEDSTGGDGGSSSGGDGTGVNNGGGD